MFLKFRLLKYTIAKLNNSHQLATIFFGKVNNFATSTLDCYRDFRCIKLFLPPELSDILSKAILIELWT